MHFHPQLRNCCVCSVQLDAFLLHSLPLLILRYDRLLPLLQSLERLLGLVSKERSKVPSCYRP